MPYKDKNRKGIHDSKELMKKQQQKTDLTVTKCQILYMSDTNIVTNLRYCLESKNRAD